MWTGTAWDWVVVAVCWALAFGVFRAIGGVDGAANAFQNWGRASAKKRAGKLALPSARSPSPHAD